MQCRWFVTTDKRILKKCVDMGIEVLNPVDFIRVHGEDFHDKG